MTEPYELAYKDYVQGMKYKDIAEKYGVTVNAVKSWKSRKWTNMVGMEIGNELLVATKKVANDKKVATKKVGAKATENVDNIDAINKVKKTRKKQTRRSGNPNPVHQFQKQNGFAVTHGLKMKYLVPEQLAIMEEFRNMDISDHLWLQIELSFASIIRAQRIMWVQDANDHTEVVTSTGEGGESYKIAFAHEKYESFIKAQTRAFAEHRNLVRQFLELTNESDERRLKLEHMQASINKTKAETEFAEMRAAKLKGETKDTSLLDSLMNVFNE